MHAGGRRSRGSVPREPARRAGLGRRGSAGGRVRRAPPPHARAACLAACSPRLWVSCTSGMTNWPSRTPWRQGARPPARSRSRGGRPVPLPLPAPHGSSGTYGGTRRHTAADFAHRGRGFTLVSIMISDSSTACGNDVVFPAVVATLAVLKNSIRWRGVGVSGHEHPKSQLS